jgi:hypothetical protein
LAFASSKAIFSSKSKRSSAIDVTPPLGSLVCGALGDHFEEKWDGDKGLLVALVLPDDRQPHAAEDDSNRLVKFPESRRFATSQGRR